MGAPPPPPCQFSSVRPPSICSPQRGGGSMNKPAWWIWWTRVCWVPFPPVQGTPSEEKVGSERNGGCLLGTRPSCGRKRYFIGRWARERVPICLLSLQLPRAQIVNFTFYCYNPPNIKPPWAFYLGGVYLTIQFCLTLFFFQKSIFLNPENTFFYQAGQTPLGTAMEEAREELGIAFEATQFQHLGV